MVTVACVLKMGGDTYDQRWVYALKRQVNRHIPEHRFVCLTDFTGIPPIWRVPLAHDFPGWWSKLELFRPGVFEPGERILYMDLDTLVIDDPGELLEYDGEFGMIRGFYKPVRQSGLMMWTPGEISEDLWRKWIASPEKHMKTHRGDGRWIHGHVLEADQLLDLYPGHIVSFKVHAREEPPEGARIVCGHGRPRFSSPSAGWAHEHWKRLVS